MKLEFEGMEVLTQRIEQLGQSSNYARDEAIRKGAEIMQKETVKQAPILTGNLRRHIEISEIENGEISVYVDNQGKAFYGTMVEFGTSKMRPQPFMSTAFNRSKWKIEREIVNTLRMRLGLSE